MGDFLLRGVAELGKCSGFCGEWADVRRKDLSTFLGRGKMAREVPIYEYVKN